MKELAKWCTFQTILKILVCSFICITIASLNNKSIILVSADDTDDVLSKYNMIADTISKNKLENEIASIEKDIEAIKLQQKEEEKHNVILKQYVEQYNSILDKVMNDIEIYQNKNKIISNNISNNILDSNIVDLLKEDSAYKTNNYYIEELLGTLNEYMVNDNYKNMYLDSKYLEDLEVQLSETKVLYADKLDNFELGDVYNIKWIMPNERVVTSSYGYRINPLNKKEIRFHSGTDYRASMNTPVGALFNGEVLACGWSDTAGYYVTIMSGDNIKYMICHLSSINVKEGQKVNQYDIIAHSGNTGSDTTGPHLHLALYINGATYDVNQLFE